MISVSRQGAGRMKVLHVSPEAVPFSKVGGLADVAGSLPPALGELGADCRLLTPAWPGVLDMARDKGFRVTRITRKAEAAIRWKIHKGTLWKCSGNGMTAYLLEEPSLFSDPVYPDELTPDSVTPFLFLSLAALSFPEASRWRPHIFHCHDWSTAPLPAALQWHLHFQEIPYPYKTVFTIHNLAHQGLLPLTSLQDWGITAEGSDVGGFEFYGMANLMKGALVASDAITTVSPGYAEEIMTEELGEGLGGLLRSLAPKVSGILNGLDDQYWDPQTDPCLPKNYSVKNLKGKAACRQKLLEKAGWEDDGKPVFVSVGRMAEQKGFSILLPALEQMTDMNCRLFVVGSGQREYESQLEEAASRHPDSIFVFLGYDEPLAHLAYAGGDFFIMPSRFEPCGLSQLIALRYGTVPVVRAVGGLGNTVFEDGPGKNGFIFRDYSPEELLGAVARAYETFRDREAMTELIRAGMRGDYSWRRSAPLYKKLYESILTRT